MPACNAVHLAQRFPIRIPDDFSDGESIRRFDGIDDLRPQVDAALGGSDDARELIAAGRHHLFRHHLTTGRARYFLDRIDDRLPGGRGRADG